ncbi:EAL domain-containing protein [Ammoniphilus sp. CFH 90114]|uniref:bifunctional diguanylate cyclase/phosphodiesterase n=1 Tax=Ammoniphilus sp. CFH 90114 TaxID=2493665 RepID=UPI00100E4FBB|nr:EAL domain-containing protein [Ammoniphilus sp. CFH 90114]RXT07079.1 EAL domain-containing protein [Ammoniphilus sp. CFH 90114]
MFSLPHTDQIVILDGHYSIPIVLLSIVIACFASYTALSINERIHQNHFFHEYFWVFLASIVMGLGIWSMHFIGMGAFMLSIPMEYDLLLTVLSVVPAIMASFLAFYISNRKNRISWQLLPAGMFMGLGISTMHYVGMAAMKMEAEYSYKPFLFFLSIGIAIVVSYAALCIFSTMQKFMGNQLVKWITALIMGCAIASMHYTGMAAVVFYTFKPILLEVHDLHQMNFSPLLIGVTVCMIIILGLSGLTSILDRYVEYRFHYYDSLTLLPNRRHFDKKYNMPFSSGSLVIIQLHDLDKWSYSSSDEIIKSVSEVIKGFKEVSRYLYRIDENRFAILTPNHVDNSKLKHTLTHMMAALQKPMVIDHQEVVIDLVCVIASSDKREEKDQLLSHAMAVLHHQSIPYNGEIVEFDPSIHTYVFERQLAKDIDQAMEKDELFLVYQPKVGLRTTQVVGVEALLRWNHPVHGQISPGVFIPILEENGRIEDVTDWVIRQVCKQIHRWFMENQLSIKVSVNIPGPYLTSPRLMEELEKSITSYNVSSRDLELEVTESSVMTNIESAIRVIDELRGSGFSVALDDFGTGVSSLSYLKRLPISTLKIDKSFIDGVPESDKDSNIMKAMITLARSLDLEIVIEGVETREQMEFLQRMEHLPIIQGYYFSKPLHEKELVDWLERFGPLQMKESQSV